MDGYDAHGLMDRIVGLTTESGGRWFEDVAIGERIDLHPRRIDAGMVVAFADAAGLTDGSVEAVEPFHLLLHSLCTAFAEGMQLTSDGLVSQCCRFTRRATGADMLHPALQVIALHPETTDGIVVLRSTIHTQTGEMLMDGEQHYRVRRRRCRHDA